MMTQVGQQIKFSLWDFARRHPKLGAPIRYTGKLSTKQFRQNHERKLREAGPSLLPPDRYLRDSQTPTQCLVWLTKSEFESPSGQGIAILLNHLRIPYRRIHPSEAPIVRSQEPAILISLAHHQHDIMQNCPGDQILRIFFCATTRQSQSDATHLIPQDPVDLFPYNAGLRSSLTVAFLKILLANRKCPVITGFMPPQVGLRIDDVAGEKIEDYLSPMLENGWVPNLGIFVDDFRDKGTDSASQLSHLANRNNVELSPHAFSANRFLFFDYRKGRPLRSEVFAEYWQYAQKAFAAWSLPISSVVNAHFHVVSNSCLPLLKEKGIRYIYSELAPDHMAILPDAIYLPSGDPLHTTGQINQDFIQIFSGDSAQDCNQPYSQYDFLMHREPSDPIENAAEKIVHRLEMSIHSGFAAFVTTHEYLLNVLKTLEHSKLWEAVEHRLGQWAIPCSKVSLADIGQTCDDHSHTVIQSVKHQNGRWHIQLQGKASGQSHLSILLKKQIQQLRVPGFQGTLDVEYA